MEKIKVDVHFRKFKGDFDGQVTAVFPYVTETCTDVACYAHIGQHSICCFDYVGISKPATPKEYSDLKKELESIGYEVNVIKKRGHSKYLKAYWSKRGSVNIHR